MFIMSGYSMLATTSTTLMLSIIFLILSYQSGKNYMRLWGVSWLVYSLMFALDFINITHGILLQSYIMFRQLSSLIGSYLFMLGTCRFFQIRFYHTFNALTLVSTIIIAIYPLSEKIVALFIVPNIMLCSGMLIISACMFISISWTQNLPEKLAACILILIWSIFMNHFGFTIKNESLAIAEYFIGIITVNILMLVLIIIYFKRLRFIDSVTSSRFRRLVENSSDSMFLYDYKKQEFEYASPTISSLIGISPARLYEMPESFFDFITVDKEEKKLLKIFSGPVDEPGNGILNYYKNDTQKKWVEIHYVPIRDNTGTVSAVEGILRDVTQKKKTEESLRATEKSKKEFLENISHEIKTPVTLIQGYTESMINKVIPMEMADTYLKLINSKADMLTTLLDDLTQAANYTSQNMEYRFYEHNAAEMFDELLLQAEFHISSSNRKALIVSDIPDDIIVIADSYRIQQVISNLVGNAIRHTPSGNEISVSCTIGKEREPSDTSEESSEYNIPAGEIILTVSDTGDGIREEYLPHIFERSFSEKKPNSSQRSGLGLFISKQIIIQHSGSIYARNKKTRGAEVIFTLPFYN